MVLALPLAASPRFWLRYWVLVALALSSALLACLWIIRLDWYAGAPSKCFLDEDTFDAICVLCPLGFLMALGAAVALLLGRRAFSPGFWRALLGAAAAILLGHAVRFGTTVSIPTFSSADALLRDHCEEAEGPAVALERPDAGTAPPWADPTCGTSTTDLGLEPRALVSRFLEKSQAGDFLQSNAWLRDAAGCPDHEPDTDAVAVVASYGVEALTQTPTSATFRIDYDVLGTVLGATPLAFRPGRRTVKRTLALEKSPWGWKLQPGLLNDGQFVSAAAILKHADENHLAFRPADEQVLEGLR
jgi:hypothetical protein